MERRVVYFPSRIFGTYAEEELPELKHLASNAVLWAAGEEPPVITDAPPSLIINIFEQPKKKEQSYTYSTTNPYNKFSQSIT